MGDDEPNADGTHYVDSESARFGMIGCLSLGFALGIPMDTYWVLAIWMALGGIYALYRAYTGDVKQLGEDRQQPNA